MVRLGLGLLQLTVENIFQVTLMHSIPNIVVTLLWQSATVSQLRRSRVCLTPGIPPKGHALRVVRALCTSLHS